MKKRKDIGGVLSSSDLEKAGKTTKKGLKQAFAIGCYKSETDNEIGRSDAHAKHMRKTRRRNFATKMNLIDPHYGKKAAGVLAAGTIIGLAATTVPAVGAALGPTVGGAVIAGGLAFLETDAHRAVGDHAILDSLLEDRDDNWRTNTTAAGYNGHGDYMEDRDNEELVWSDSDDEDLANLLPSSMGGSQSSFDSNAFDNYSSPRATPKLAASTSSASSLASSLKFLELSEDDSTAPSTPEVEDGLSFFSAFSAPAQTRSNSNNNNSAVPRPPSPTLLVVQQETVTRVAVVSGTATAHVPRPPSPQLGAISSATSQNNNNNNNNNSNSINMVPGLEFLDAATASKQREEDDFFASMMSPATLQPLKPSPVVTATPIAPAPVAIDPFANFGGSTTSNNSNNSNNSAPLQFNNDHSHYHNVSSHTASVKPASHFTPTNNITHNTNNNNNISHITPTPTTTNPTAPSNNSSFFSAVASHIPSTTATTNNNTAAPHSGVSPVRTPVVATAPTPAKVVDSDPFADLYFRS